MSAGDRLDIWYLIGSLQVGGANRTLVDLANGVDHEQFDVTVWTILGENPLADELVAPVTHRSLDAHGKTDVPAALRFIRAVHQERPDIIQSFLFFDNTLARVAGVGCPSTKILSGIRSVPEQPSNVRSAVDRLTIPLTDYVVSNSEAGRELALERGVGPEEVSVVSNGRDLSMYQNASASPELRSSLGIPREAPLVGTVGRLIERKGGYDLLDAWPKVLSRFPEARLLFVGDGPEKQGLRSRAEALGCASSVTFAGTRHDIPELLDAFDVFAFPSHFEGLPGALIEAMAAGCPIVATEATGNSELITDGETGILVPVRSPPDLADGVQTLLSNRERAVRLGDQAAAVARERFSVDRMVEEFTILYERLFESDSDFQLI